MSCTIKAVNLRGTWNLDTINDECPICRNSVLETCVECSAATSQTQCISIMGECSHIYHLHCIDKWTKTKNVCPLDNKKWEYKRPQKTNEQLKTCQNCLTPDLDIPIQENQINPDVPESIQNIINIPNNNIIINYINTSINIGATDLSNNIVVGSSTISNNNNYINDLSNNIFISNLYNNYINTSDLSNNQLSNQEPIQQSDQEDEIWSDIDSEEDDEDYQDDDDDDDDDDEVWEDEDDEESELDTNNNPTQ